MSKETAVFLFERMTQALIRAQRAQGASVSDLILAVATILANVAEGDMEKAQWVKEHFSECMDAIMGEMACEEKKTEMMQ